MGQIKSFHLSYWPDRPIMVVMKHSTIAIRHATPGDGPALSRLAALDSAPVPFGEVVLAEVDDELRAAIDVATGQVIADPFAPTAELAELLRVHVARARRREAEHAGARARARRRGLPRRARLAV
jgi:hypothetical protein